MNRGASSVFGVETGKEILSSEGAVVRPKASRPQKKASEKVQGLERKVTELITSSARKQKNAATLPKKNEVLVGATNLNARCSLLHNETSDACMGFDGANGSHEHLMDGGKKETQVDMVDAHSSREAVTSASGEEILVDKNGVISNTDSGAVLSSEVSAIYLAMKNSKLECVDEHGQDSLSTDVCVEDEYYEEFDDFDPHLFIKNLPELSSVVPTFRPLLLPRQTRSCPSTTLVLDLDETLVHSSLEPCDDTDRELV
ncbi:hypothetical protein V6N11_011625 [Hibiscus sabdariffa]|uniref:FCP1 homology domain-containing protein n=1 Tax=Hibiscus sabdariffa TaxID=183260 RepID=A0ABR2S8S2_9ROSI